MTASGFPTRGRAHPSASGGSLVRSCREKNLSPYRTVQKVLNQHGQPHATGQERFRGRVAHAETDENGASAHGHLLS
jgi:hypothetical protein